MKHIIDTDELEKLQKYWSSVHKCYMVRVEDFSPDYTSGLAFAIARDETDARQLIVKQRGYEPYDWGTMKIYPLTRRIAKSVSGGG